ncbi:phosphoribosyltransferase [Roseivivax sp. THAF40]|uniref:phosphoribosyltransferase n=1 Tax=Roseivivax sp. THAF40 TaxID=2587858 RepID=UPI001269419B|nr:phosphoribosyltransferase [Roseivivax sp. THAF40]
MADDEILRAKETMTRDMFGMLMQLTTQQPWLTRRSEELYDTLAVCDDEGQKNLIVDLISRFHFRSAQQYLEDRRSIASKISRDWKCLPTNTMLIALQDNGCADSSSAAVQQFKGPLAEYADWKTHNFISSLREVVDRTKDGSNIIIVDDFCGSGETISKKVLWLREKLQQAGKSASLFVAVGSSMEQSKEVICPLVKDFYSVHWLKKGICDFYSGQDSVNAVKLMESIEEELADRYGNKKIKDYAFGWRRSEALCYLEGENPPNNNFPIFWWRKVKPNLDRTALLPRV